MDYIEPLRVINTFLYLVVFVLFKGYRKKKLAIAMLLFFVSDFCVMNYNQLLYNNLTSIIRTLGYFFIALHLVPKFKLEMESKKALLAYSIVIIFCAVMFYELIDLMSLTLQDVFHKYLYFSYALVLLILLIIVGNYNFRYNSIQSTTSMYFIFSLIISDLFAFITYYLDMDAFYYPTRIFYIIGLATLTAYAVLPFRQEVLFKDETLAN
ncbi:hypothetical protein [Formosa algae]|uniref:Membrane protein YqjE n=2 Tax=Formosa algae TaxID=225843 RepID=A0A9X1C872_9FLAO|nr:hypothetical protein [Formosa algae]MBP1838816.1 putative membrane protein YqjE [Formosa algae]MDQ0333593.1 putative membrane protein YqjE [Formosa algae]OEI80271.1 hypothetical protein AST99_10175 [Formosa algae]